MVSQKNYYRTLDVEKTAGQREIKEAYRKLAFLYHPDRNKGEAAAVEKMKEINEAYAVLSDPEKRDRYDLMQQQYGIGAHDRFRQSYSEQDIFRGSDINQIFEEMAKTFGFRGFEEIFRDIPGHYRTTEFRGPGLFGRVIVFGPGFRRSNRTSGPESLRAAGYHREDRGPARPVCAREGAGKHRIRQERHLWHPYPGRARGGAGRKGRLLR